MRFRGLDLNLLVALDALLTEQNVSVAAERVFLSQSAMSGALNRLREYFRDDLLVPSGRRMMLTPRAESLIAPVKAVLLQIDATITTAAATAFEPATTERDFSILTSDYSMLVMGSPTVRAIAGTAPRARVLFEMVDDTAPDKLERGLADVIVSPRQFAVEHHPLRELWVEEAVVIAWSGAKRTQAGVDADLYFELPHVAVRFDHSRTPTFEDWMVRARTEQRRIEVVSPSFAPVPALVVGTERIATVHRGVAEFFAETLPISLYPLPFQAPPLTMCAQWHRLKDKDPGLHWLVDQLAAHVAPLKPNPALDPPVA